jgi:hypothetical protein
MEVLQTYYKANRDKNYRPVRDNISVEPQI